MTHAVRIHTTGGPGCLHWEKVDLAGPGPGEARLRHEAIGLNFIDVYHRTGLYRLPALPATLGMEAAGVVVAVGEGVSEVAVGDRVAYAGPPVGAYAEERLIPAHRLVRLPEAIDARQAAAMMLKGMTARYLLRSTFRVEPGQTILLHAAAGGVGLIICQWARHLGATVIGTVGSPAKAELAQAHGCSHTILYRDEDFVKRVQEITQGEGVHVVYDAVGRDTFLRSRSRSESAVVVPEGLVVPDPSDSDGLHSATRGSGQRRRRVVWPGAKRCPPHRDQSKLRAGRCRPGPP